MNEINVSILRQKLLENVYIFLDDRVESKRVKIRTKPFREFGFVIDREKHNYRIKTQDVRFSNSPLYIFEAEVAKNFKEEVCYENQETLKSVEKGLQNLVSEISSGSCFFCLNGKSNPRY